MLLLCKSADEYFYLGKNAPDSQITWLYPPKGHIKGGALLTIYGAKFQRSPFLKVGEGHRDRPCSPRAALSPPPLGRTPPHASSPQQSPTPCSNLTLPREVGAAGGGTRAGGRRRV